ncbi:MAG: hypothetical protein ACFE9D_02005 [Promethearchaeota archaeon]
MKCVLCVEYRTPKDEVRGKQLLDWQEKLGGKTEEWLKKGLISPDVTFWADNTGRIMYWIPFESMEKFAKFYGNADVQKMMAISSGLLDDISIRLLRPGIDVSDLK